MIPFEKNKFTNPCVKLVSSSFMTPAAAGAESNLSAPVLSETSFRYLTEDGIEIISYVDTWPKDRLPEVAEELYQNRHGLEMEYLDRIEIHPGSEPSGNEQVSASYEIEQQQLSIPIKLSGFLPDDYQLKVPVEKGVIRIFKGEENQK